MKTSEHLQNALDRYKRIKQGRFPNQRRELEAIHALFDATLAVLVTSVAADELMLDVLDSYVRLASKEQNSGKPWTEEDDEFIINARVSGDNLVQIAALCGRTPAAVASRMSVLIGIRRDSINIDGKRIQGDLDGSEVDGRFTGILHRNS